MVAIGGSSSSSFIRLPQGCRGHGAAGKGGQRDNGQHIRDHGQEVVRDVGAGDHENICQHVSPHKDHGSRHNAGGFIPAEDHRSQGDIASPGHHFLGEGIQQTRGQERAPHGDDGAAHDGGGILGAGHVDPQGIRHLGVFAYRAQVQARLGAEQVIGNRLFSVCLLFN